MEDIFIKQPPSCDRCQLLLKLLLLLDTSSLPIKCMFYMHSIEIWWLNPSLGNSTSLLNLLSLLLYCKWEPRLWVGLLFNKFFKTRSSPSTVSPAALLTLVGKAQISTNLSKHKVHVQKLQSLADDNTGIKPSSISVLKHPFNCMLPSSPLTKTEQKNKQTSLTWEAAFRCLEQSTEIKAISSKTNTSRCTGKDSKQCTRHKYVILHPNRFPG